MKQEVSQQTVSEKRKKKKSSGTFLLALALLSILGFIEIISISLFEFEFGIYNEALLMVVLGIALILEAKITQLVSIRKRIDSDNFPKLITLVIGVVSVIAGIFSFPQLRVENPVFSAIKGILAVIAIVIIIISTWIIDKKQ